MAILCNTLVKLHVQSPQNAGRYQLNLMNHSIIPCADFSLAQPSIKQQLMIIQKFQRFCKKNIRLFSTSGSPRVPKPCVTPDMLLDLLQYIFCTTAKFLRESLVGFYNIVVKALLFEVVDDVTNRHKRAIKYKGSKGKTIVSLRIIVLKYIYWLIICLKWSSLREAGCAKAAMEDQVINSTREIQWIERQPQAYY